MAFFKKVRQKINGLYYPRSVTVGKPVTTDEIGRRLSARSTVSPADTVAVLKDLGPVMGDLMAQGRTVKLDGLGTFYYTAITNGNGVETEEEVTASLITGVRVRFIPETRRTSSNKVITRSMVSDDIFWEEWGGTKKTSGGTGGDDGSGGSGDPNA